MAIYPILEWIFNNCEKLKERAYLAKYLVKTDIPGKRIRNIVVLNKAGSVNTWSSKFFNGF